MWLLAEDHPSADPVANLALEEALVRAGPAEPVLRVWRAGRCVVLGRGQRPAREVDEVASRRDGVPVLRRSSGGGTVYLDPGTLNISLVLPGRHPELTADLAGLLVEALHDLGIAADAAPRGVFVAVAGEPFKVSGLAAQVTIGATLAHATLLVTTPAADVTRYLAPAPAEPHPLDSHRSAVRPLRDLDPGIDPAVATRAVLAAATRRHGPLLARPPYPAEVDRLADLLARRYRNPTWHQSARTEEAPWTRRPALSCTG